MKTIKLKDLAYKVLILYWEDSLQKDMERELKVRKFVSDILAKSNIEINEGNLVISKGKAVTKYENGGLEFGIKQSIEDSEKEVEIPKYITFYYGTVFSKDSIEVDYRLKSFRRLKDAEEEVKEVFYNKSDYAILLKGLEQVIYRIVTKDIEGTSKELLEKDRVNREDKIYIQYYDND